MELRAQIQWRCKKHVQFLTSGSNFKIEEAAKRVSPFSKSSPSVWDETAAHIIKFSLYLLHSNMGRCFSFAFVILRYSPAQPLPITETIPPEEFYWRLPYDIKKKY